MKVLIIATVLAATNVLGLNRAIDYTQYSIGCPCYFNEQSYACSCCVLGGCQDTTGKCIKCIT